MNHRKHRKVRWGVLVLIGFVVLVFAALLLPPLPKARARASRIHSVNRVANVSIILPGTNAPPAARTNE